MRRFCRLYLHGSAEVSHFLNTRNRTTVCLGHELDRIIATISCGG